MQFTIIGLFVLLSVAALSFAEGTLKTLNSVPPLAWGKSGETTFCGALAAVASTMDLATNYPVLMGDSALAFRTRWWRKDEGAGWCPSSPVGEMSPWDERAAESMGVKLTFKNHLDGQTDMSRYADEVKRSIDAGRPVLGYSDNLDMAVIYGYDEDGKIVHFRDYFKGDKPHTLPLGKTKGLLVFVEKTGQPAPMRNRAHAALLDAVEDWRHPKDSTNNPKGGGGYYFGDAAYAKWINDLTSDQLTDADRKALFHPSWWTFCVLADARQQATKYLKHIAPIFHGDARAAIERAADLYAQSAMACGEAFEKKDAFLGPWSGKKIDAWTPEVRQREAAILEKVRKTDNAAILELEKAAAAIK